MTRVSRQQDIRETLDRIAALNPSLNAFITVFEAEAMAQARILDDELREGRSRGPLHGLPVSIKDLIDVKGAPTSAASRVRQGHIAQADATVVSRLREAGAVIIGKCNLHEFALGTTNDESAFGPARNPHDTARSPGGSSGGSAAAVAAGLGWASVGSDTGGSIRIPAAACGIVGLKPAFGEIPTAGVVALSVSLDHVGPLAATVRDAWILYGALKGTGDVPDAPAPLSQLRLGKLGGYFADLLDGDIRRVFADRDRQIECDAGPLIRDVRLAHTGDIARTYLDVALTEAFAYHAKTLDSHSAEYLRRRSRTTRDGKEHSGRRLHRSSADARNPASRGGCRLVGLRRAGASDLADSSSQNRRAEASISTAASRCCAR